MNENPIKSFVTLADGQAFAIVIHANDPDEEVGFWVECPELEIASQGDTVDECKANIAEVLELYFGDIDND